MAIAQLPDVRLNYRIDGEVRSPALLLSNSLGTSLTMWEPQIAALSDTVLAAKVVEERESRKKKVLESDAEVRAETKS